MRFRVRVIHLLALPVVALLLSVPATLAAAPRPSRPTSVVRCGVIDLNRVIPEQGFAYTLPFFAADGDGGPKGNTSPVQLFEDTIPLGPAHSPHADIRSQGKGRFSHWGNSLRFSASDNTDPRANGRAYYWAVPTGTACPVQICGQIDVSQAHPDGGVGYVLAENFGFPGDSAGKPALSSLQLYEGTLALGPAHSVHADIRAQGQGRYSHWGNSLHFSASDNSDPRSNGRPYFYGGACRALHQVRFTKLASNAPFFATFGSYNQHVVDNVNGVFVDFLTSMTPGPNWANGSPLDSHSDWQVLRSTDSGTSFTLVYTGRRQTSHVPPVLDADAEGNLYVFAPQFNATTGADVDVLQFLAASGFGSPTKRSIPAIASDKFSSTFDRRANRFYFAATGYGPGHPARIATVPVSGHVSVSNPVAVEGSHGFLMYPLLRMDDSGNLYLAWTTQELPKLAHYLYWDIHLMRSPDGGQTWTTLSGSPLRPPVVVDGDGPADRLTLPDEDGTHPWLAGFLPRSGMLHFYYETEQRVARQHYVRYNTAAGRFDVNLYPAFKGNSLMVKGMSGFFVARPETGASPLYFVGENANQGTIVVLASDDEGQTWFDYATSRQRFPTLYNLTGPKEIGASGQILGLVTALQTKDEAQNANDVWLLTAPAE